MQIVNTITGGLYTYIESLSTVQLNAVFDFGKSIRGDQDLFLTFHWLRNVYESLQPHYCRYTN